MTEDKPGKFDGLHALSTAAAIWDLDDSTLRKAIADGRLVIGEDCTKFGKQWVVTEEAMFRLYGCPQDYTDHCCFTCRRFKDCDKARSQEKKNDDHAPCAKYVPEDQYFPLMVHQPPIVVKVLIS